MAICHRIYTATIANTMYKIVFSIFVFWLDIRSYNPYCRLGRRDLLRQLKNPAFAGFNLLVLFGCYVIFPKFLMCSAVFSKPHFLYFLPLPQKHGSLRPMSPARGSFCSATAVGAELLVEPPVILMVA